MCVCGGGKEMFVQWSFMAEGFTRSMCNLEIRDLIVSFDILEKFHFLKTNFRTYILKEISYKMYNEHLRLFEF